jgi:hypothetical protein
MELSAIIASTLAVISALNCPTNSYGDELVRPGEASDEAVPVGRGAAPAVDEYQSRGAGTRAAVGDGGVLSYEGAAVLGPGTLLSSFSHEVTLSACN